MCMARALEDQRGDILAAFTADLDAFVAAKALEGHALEVRFQFDSTGPNHARSSKVYRYKYDDDVVIGPGYIDTPLGIS